jgi:hypothetical protein
MAHQSTTPAITLLTSDPPKPPSKAKQQQYQQQHGKRAGKNGGLQPPTKATPGAPSPALVPVWVDSGLTPTTHGLGPSTCGLARGLTARLRLLILLFLHNSYRHSCPSPFSPAFRYSGLGSNCSPGLRRLRSRGQLHLLASTSRHRPFLGSTGSTLQLPNYDVAAPSRTIGSSTLALRLICPPMSVFSPDPPLHYNHVPLLSVNRNSIPVTSTSHTILPNSLHLNNVLVAPNLINNLIYVLQFTSDNNCSVEFDPLGCSVKDLPSRREIVRCDSSGLSTCYGFQLPPFMSLSLHHCGINVLDILVMKLCLN